MFLRRGFTLIEVMLVLLIMGMVASMIIINPLRDEPAQLLEKEAQRFFATVSLASDYAVLNQAMLGVRFEPKDNSYAFVELNENQEWTTLSGADWMKPHQVNAEFSFKVILEGLDWIDEDSFLGSGSLFDETLSVSDASVQIGNDEDEPPPPPEIFLYPSGEIGDWAVAFIFAGDGFDASDPVQLEVQGQSFLPLVVSELETYDQ